MIKFAKASLTLTAIALLASCGEPAPDAADQSSPETSSAPQTLPNGLTVAEQIEARQAGFKKLGKAFKTIVDQMRSGDADMSIIETATASVPEVTAGIETWFPAGTGPESGIKTEALPVIWEKPEEFGEKVANFKTAAAALALAGKSGNMETVSAAFRTTGGTCKACHDTFRLDD